MLADFFRPVPKKRSVKLVGKKGVLFRNLNTWQRYAFYSGNFVLLFGISYLLYLYYPLGIVIFKFNSVPTTNLVGGTLAPPVDNEFSIAIPKLGAYSIVVPNISPFSVDEYSKVLEKDMVAQAKGSNLPGGGLGKTTYLFAHSTRQGLELVRHNSIFYLLGELKNDDDVFVKYQGNIFSYKVYDRKVVSPKQVEFLKYTEPDKELVVLQTCWPIGTDWNRLLVFARRI